MTSCQGRLLRKYGLSPENWIVFSESSSDLVVLSKRSRRRKVLDKKGKTDGKRSK